jgi:gluconate 2-dehydrogenase gamma chain
MYLQDYCNSAYGGKFENLSSTQQTQVLQDLFDNKPTNFEGPTPPEFFNEIHDMVTAGFWADPLYGGNVGMVGWALLASNGVNSGAAQGFTTIQLATASSPTKIPPLSLGDIQRGATM